jgi:hypothetical protein
MFVTRTFRTGRIGTSNVLEENIASIDSLCDHEATQYGTPLVKSRLSVGYVPWLSGTAGGTKVFADCLVLFCCCFALE